MQLELTCNLQISSIDNYESKNDFVASQVFLSVSAIANDYTTI